MVPREAKNGLVRMGFVEEAKYQRWKFKKTWIKQFPRKEDFVPRLSVFVNEVSADAGLILSDLWTSVFDKNNEKLELELYAGDIWRPSDFSTFKKEGNTLFTHQIEGARFVLLRDMAILAHDTGIGKTITAAVTGKSLDKKMPFLYVCPAGVRLDAYDDFKKVGIVPFLYPDNKGKKRLYPNPDNFLQADVVIMSYDAMKDRFSRNVAMRKQVETLLVQHSPLLVFDECHKLKNQGTIQTEKGLKLAKRFADSDRKVLFMSATPVVSKPKDLFNILNLIDPVEFDDYYKFTARYMNGQYVEKVTHGNKMRQVWELGKAQNLLELHAKIQDYTHRRLKEDCLDLPEKIRIRTLLEGIRVTVPECHPRGFIMKYKHSLAMAKVKESVEMAINTGERTIIATEYKQPALKMIELLKAEGVSCDMIAGQIGDMKKNIAKRKFMSGKIQVLVIVISAAGEGLNLQNARYVIVNDLPWTGGALKQAEDRAHRAGTKNEVIVILNIAADDDFDLNLYDIVENTYKVSNAIMDGKSVEDVHLSDEEDVKQEMIKRLKKSRKLKKYVAGI
jgi:SNF2 family DNA or RNA helicase